MTDYKAIRDLTCCKCGQTYPIAMCRTMPTNTDPMTWTIMNAMPHGPSEDRCTGNTWIGGNNDE